MSTAKQRDWQTWCKLLHTVNSTGLAEGSGIREEIVGGAAKSNAVRTSASALQLQMK